MSMKSQETINALVQEKLDDIGKDVGEILEQVRTTNGRVSALENWRWALAGGLTVITIVVVPLFLDLIR